MFWKDIMETEVTFRLDLFTDKYFVQHNEQFPMQ
jgi:hypothetical protein